MPEVKHPVEHPDDRRRRFSAAAKNGAAGGGAEALFRQGRCDLLPRKVNTYIVI